MGENIMKLILIIIAILIMNIYVVSRIYHRKNAKKIKYSEIFSQLKTGDIILFRADDASLVPILIFGDSFSHVGIVYEKDGQYFIVESVGGKDHNGMGNNERGVTISPLYAKILTYPGTTYLKRLNKPLDFAKLRLFDIAIEKYGGSNFYYKNPVEYAKKCVIIARNKNNKSNNFSCAMIISRIIQDIGLIKINNNEICMRPQCFNNLYKYGEYCDGYFYVNEIYLLIPQ